MIRHGFEDLGMWTIWCGYYDGNEKSRRVQEKCGFSYYRTTKDLDVPLMGEKRTGHMNVLTREDWLKRTGKKENHSEPQKNISGKER